MRNILYLIDATALKTYITGILKYNCGKNDKKTFAYRIFMYSDGKNEDKKFKVNMVIPRKNKKLEISENTLVPDELLYNGDEIRNDYIEVLERMINSYQMTKRQKEAMRYAITSTKTIERLKPILKDIEIIMKDR